MSEHISDEQLANLIVSVDSHCDELLTGEEDDILLCLRELQRRRACDPRLVKIAGGLLGLTGRQRGAHADGKLSPDWEQPQ